MDSMRGEAMDVTVTRIPIKLDAFLKLAGALATGGQAKTMLADGNVRVNGEMESRRGRKLVMGDVVSLPGAQFRVVARDGTVR